MADRLRPFDGARELIAELDGRGLRVVLATSAPEDELATLRTVLDVDRHLTGVTSSGDVETAKPEPDIVLVALERAGVGADEAVFVGDTIWDIQAAGKAGVPTIGVRSGGVSEEELRGAGAVEVYDDVRDLLDHLDDSEAIGFAHACFLSVGAPCRGHGVGCDHERCEEPESRRSPDR